VVKVLVYLSVLKACNGFTIMSITNDVSELKKIATNRLLFGAYKCDYFAIETVLKILNVATLPVAIPISNNQVFIRDLSKYIAENNLKPNIDKQ